MKHHEITRPVAMEGRQILLRDLRPGDVTQAYVDWMNDPEVVRFTESRFAPHTIGSIRDFVQGFSESPTSILFGIFSKEEPLHIGNIKLGPVNWHHGLADLALIVGNKNFWGRGIAAEAISLASRYAFDELRLCKLTAGCYADNKASEKAFKKAGFEVEAVRPLHHVCDGRRVDGIELGMLNPAMITTADCGI